jgi:hypothetical protein
MSARNGDKSRHAINKRRVRAQRVKIRELVKTVKQDVKKELSKSP